jgi:hypothetical protein
VRKLKQARCHGHRTVSPTRSPLFERRTVARAEGTDREQFIAAPGKKHRFAAYVAEQHGSVRDR